MTDDFERARLEAAELLGLDPDKLTPGDRLRCELISALRAAVDDELGKVTSSRAADLGKLIIAVETLTRFLADAKPKEDERGAIYRKDPYKVMDDIVARFIAAEEADRRERGLGPKIHDEAELQARVDDLELELVRLRGAQPHALPAPDAGEPIDVPTGDVVPPGEQTDRNFHRGGPRPGPDDRKAGPKPVIEGSWTGPADGPPPWLRKVPPVKSEDRPPATPPQTKSGGETEAQRQRVNADRSVEHRVMGNPRMPQPDAGGFHWGGSKGRAW